MPSLPDSQPYDPFVLRWAHGVLDCRPGAVPHVMGILNVTPDSFSDGGTYLRLDAALRRAETMLEEGAVLIDVGGESSRPRGTVYGAGAEALDVETEKQRVLPVVEALARRFPEALISVDTYKADMGRAAVEAGAAVLNDITGLRHDPALADVAARHKVPLVVMHSLGTPGAMPHSHRYTDVVQEVRAALAVSVQQAEARGVAYVLTDPGFGFGKTVDENLKVLAGIPALLTLNRPVLVGISRKSTIGALLGTPEQPAPVSDRLFGSLGATAVAVLRGASVVRTHDVQPTVELLRVLHAVREAPLNQVQEVTA